MEAKDNLILYNALRTPPKEALKPIEAGRLKGKTDINPMWRIQALTQQFGPCGIGWKYTIDRQWLETGAGGEVVACCDISLYIFWDGKWSEAIPGTGGNMLVAKERNGLYTSDEAYKMALTDALSVACKALGAAGDIYWQNDPAKYTYINNGDKPQAPAKEGASTPGKYPPPIRCQLCGTVIGEVTGKSGKAMAPEVYAAQVQKKYGRVLCPACVETTEAIIPPPLV